MNLRKNLAVALLALALFQPAVGSAAEPADKRKTPMSDTIEKTNEEWKKLLTPDQFQVLRKKGTERAFSGEYWNNHENGIYNCAACGSKLFAAEDKFDSGTGWPSFSAPAATDSVRTETDRGLFTTRTEVLCRRCGGHLGHVFEDGPHPTGLRYCINSVCLKFEKKKE